MSQGQLILAYHGCDVTVRDQLVSRQLNSLTPSANRYDWLGDGIYFFEGDVERALAFAQSACDEPERLLSAKPIVEPTVVGAILCVARCWDMMGVAGRNEFQVALAALGEAEEERGVDMPMNDAADPLEEVSLVRSLDCAVFNMGHKLREDRGELPYQAVRAAFYQGRRIVESSEFRKGSHIQLAVRDPSCVLGWFLPPSLGGSLLTEREYQAAKEAMARAKHARSAQKPRIRASLW